MAETARGPFRADQVGSLLRPAELKVARERHAKGELPAEALAALEDRLITEAIARQEETGIQAITDGDFRRASWSGDFLGAIGGVQLPPPPSERNLDQVAAGQVHRDWQPPAPKTVDKLVWPAGGVQGRSFDFLARATSRTAKVCIPSPSMLHFRGGRGGVDRDAYPDMERFFADAAAVWRAELADLAARGCRYVQLDDTNLAYLCDPRMRERARQLGEDPDALPAKYAGLINDAIAGRPDDMTVTIHLCRGNSVSRGMAEGGYEPVAEAMFNEVAVDGFFLEYDSERAGDFRPLRFVPPGKKVVLGLITSKFGELESADALMGRIDEAAQYVPLDQLCLSPQCGFASHTAGNILSEAQQWAKLRLTVEVADRVWG